VARSVATRETPRMTGSWRAVGRRASSPRGGELGWRASAPRRRAARETPRATWLWRAVGRRPSSEIDPEWSDSATRSFPWYEAERGGPLIRVIYAPAEYPLPFFFSLFFSFLFFIWRGRLYIPPHPLILPLADLLSQSFEVKKISPFRAVRAGRFGARRRAAARSKGPGGQPLGRPAPRAASPSGCRCARRRRRRRRRRARHGAATREAAAWRRSRARHWAARALPRERRASSFVVFSLEPFVFVFYRLRHSRLCRCRTSLLRPSGGSL
jgi:hypothetical protein